MAVPDDMDAGPAQTPLSVANRPGLPALRYRVGTHGAFLETMKARLSTFVPGEDGGGTPPLAGLTMREPSDPAIAMLDAWSVVGDVLTFYQERIANEGFLRTAIERRSVQALAAQVGYAMRPGVASSVYLAFGVEDVGSDEAVPIAAGSRVQSEPDSGALPQTFETSDPLVARASLNALTPRLRRPQQPTEKSDVLYFKGVSTGLRPNDPLLLANGAGPVELQPVRRVALVETQFADDRTRVTLQPAPIAIDDPKRGFGRTPEADAEMFRRLMTPPARHPRNAVALAQDFRITLSPKADAGPQLLSAFRPALRSQIYAAIGNADVEVIPDPVHVYAFRVRAAPFGNNAPLDAVLDNDGKLVGRREWTLRRSAADARSAERFNLALTRIAGEPFAFRVRVRIGDAAEASGDNSAKPGEPVVIDYKDAAEVVQVTISEANADPAGGEAGNGADLLLIRFRKRGVEVRVGATERAGEFAASVKGADPLIAMMGQASVFARRGIAGLERGNATPVLTISGVTRGASGATVATEAKDVVSLDTVYDQIIDKSWVIVERPDRKEPVIAHALSATAESRADYGISGRTTRLVLDRAWLDVAGGGSGEVADDFTKSIRGATVHAQSEELVLADAPNDSEVEWASLELDSVHGALEPGRWLIVEGLRADVPNTGGIRGAEVVMLAGVEHDAASDAPGERMRTVLRLASPLAYRYHRDSVTIHGNVAHATHGETRNEVLGSGDASQANPRFALRQQPLTYVSAPTTSGVESTLEVRVNDVRWHGADMLNGLGPKDRRYVTQASGDGGAVVQFGDGVAGARLPSGVDNIKAVYRTGLGRTGNVAAAKAKLLITRPLGVSSVTNPLPASGGADSETPDEARRNAPVALLALDRLVSVQDHADFARTFAGVGKSVATRLAVGQRQAVHVTVAPAEEGPLDPSSDLVRNLTQALHRFGDPHQAVLVVPGEAVLLVIDAKVRIDPDYQWDTVEPALRAALLDRFGYAGREFGQDVALSQVISAMQEVAGVDYVDVDRLSSIREQTLLADLAALSGSKPPRPRPSERIRARMATPGVDPTTGARTVLPAQVVFLGSTVSSLLNLTELT